MRRFGLTRRLVTHTWRTQQSKLTISLAAELRLKYHLDQAGELRHLGLPLCSRKFVEDGERRAGYKSTRKWTRVLQGARTTQPNSHVFFLCLRPLSSYSGLQILVVSTTVTSPHLLDQAPQQENHRSSPFQVWQTPRNFVDKRNTVRLARWEIKSLNILSIFLYERTYDPSFFPSGSSYSTPTHVPLLNFVVPTYLTVPRLLSPGSVDSISQREPTSMSTASSASGVASFCANRPTLFRCLKARTESIYIIPSIPFENIVKIDRYLDVARIRY